MSGVFYFIIGKNYPESIIYLNRESGSSKEQVQPFDETEIFTTKIKYIFYALRGVLHLAIKLTEGEEHLR